jgi:hypothetical protein
MANKDAAFGLKAIGKVGQNRDNQGLSEYSIAASLQQLFINGTQLKCYQAGTYWCSGSRRHVLLGSLNGVFYTDASTSKPTWANHLVAI